MQATAEALEESFSADWVLVDEEATRRLASDIACGLEPGDLLTLAGELGIGKTTLARHLIRCLLADPEADVPSPTFTLLQTYETPRFPILHIDLYRVRAIDELIELGFDDVESESVRLIEWPDRAAGLLPRERLDIILTAVPERGPDARRVKVVGHGRCAARAHRFSAFPRFLEESGFGNARRRLLQGDASTRIYERLDQDGQSAILMIAPRRPDGPAVRDGRSYSAIAHLAEDVTPFMAVARGLRERGFSAPEILAADLNEGLLILEDLGSNSIVSGDPPAPIDQCYTSALDMLLTLHRQDLPETLPVAPSVTYHLPKYDIDAFLIEAELLLDWYLPHHGADADPDVKAAFSSLWREALAAIAPNAPTWVLRDYHSPNLLWLPGREGIARIGVLDFQDAVMGPAAYDVVSLLQDARVDVPEALEDTLLSRYLKGRRSIDRNFDLGKFIEDYSMLGAQRATKVLGIFSRLDRRDGKPQYLRHQPRVWRNLRRCLSHPVMAPLKAWYDTHVPTPRTY
jgi:tRNA threonylcarbamoyl adenosine modification protein YjeE